MIFADLTRLTVKICGLTRAQDVQAACHLGADAVGFVFAQGGPRSLSVAQGRALVQVLASQPGDSVASVALFLDSPPALVEQVLREVQPTLVQFHGRESPADCDRWQWPYLRAVPMGDFFNPGDSSATTQAVEQWCAQFETARGFVFDAHRSGQRGGRGTRFPWQRLPRLGGRPRILAGGLNNANVAEAIEHTQADAVDVSSGVESAPGIKDEHAMRRFFKEISHVQTRFAR